MALMLLWMFLLGLFELPQRTSFNSKASNFKFSKFSKDSLTGEVIAFDNHSFTISLNVGILFGPLLLQMSSKFIKTSKIRNSEEIPNRFKKCDKYGLQS